jgi:hypothetical protein
MAACQRPFPAAAVFHAISTLKTAGAFELFRLKQKLRAGARQKSPGDARKPRHRLGFSISVDAAESALRAEAIAQSLRGIFKSARRQS